MMDIDIGQLHVFPLEDKRYGLYKWYCFIQKPPSTLSLVESLSAIGTVFALVRIGTTTKICGLDTYHDWKKRYDAGQAVPQHLWGVSVIVHNDPLPVTNGLAKKWICIPLAEPAEGEDCYNLLKHFGFAERVEVIQT